MNVTGEQTIYLYGDAITPIPAAEMRHGADSVLSHLDPGYTIIRLGYTKQRKIIDIRAFAYTADGQVYVSDIKPTILPEGYCVARYWREDAIEPEEVASWLPKGKHYAEWYLTDSGNVWETLDGPALTDFLDEFLKVTPYFWVEGDKDYLEEDRF